MEDEIYTIEELKEALERVKNTNRAAKAIKDIRTGKISLQEWKNKYYPTRKEDDIQKP